MKRFFILLLALITMMSVMVVSCGTKKDTPKTTTEVSDTTETDTTGTDTTGTDTTASDTTASDTTATDTTVSDTTVADTTKSETTKSETTKPETTKPQTTKPQTTAPTTTAPVTTEPEPEVDLGIDLVAGQAYKLVLAQVNLGKYLYATHTISGEKYFASTESASSAPDFFAEKTSAGYKFYTMISGTKSYIKAYLEGTSKRLKYDAADGTVWTYKADCKAFFTTIDGAEYCLGTYSTYNTFCISDASFMTPASSGVSQFPGMFLTTAEINKLPSLEKVTIYSNPTDIVNELYKLQPGESLSGGHKYTLTGVITEITDPFNSQYNNVTVVIVVNNMTDKPVTVFRVKVDGADTIKVGDTITVSGTLTNWNGTFEFNSGCTLDSVN